jgi:hypothetical protein
VFAFAGTRANDIVKYCLHCWLLNMEICSKGVRMVSINSQPHHIGRDAAVDRVDQAFERLKIAWRAVRARRAANGIAQFDVAAMEELDVAEAEWLAARAEASSSS